MGCIVAMRSERVQRQPVVRYGDRSVHQQEDDLAIEEPLEIRVNGTSLAVVMRTPGDDAELAAGFLFTEAIVRERADIAAIGSGVDELGLEARNTIDIALRLPVDPIEAGWQRHFYAASSCGVCGKATIALLGRQWLPVNGALRVDTRVLHRLPDRLRARQPIFDRTGGLHAAALFTPAGELMALREDVGRHNAVDKVIGWALLDARLPLSETVLMVSGRTSLEIVQKAWAGGIPVVAGISAASSLAADLAREAGITLIGFVRDGHLTVYCGAERLL